MTLAPSLGVNLACALAGYILVICLGASVRQVSRLESEDDWARVFTDLTLGNLAVVVTTAVFVTNGRTVLLTFVPIAAAALWKRRSDGGPKRLQEIGRRHLRPLVLGAIGLLIAFAFYYCGFIGSSGQVFEFAGDYHLYAKFVRHLVLMGVENPSLDSLEVQQSATPYHYGDLWHGAAAMLAFNRSGPESLALISWPLLAANYVVGGAALIEAAKGRLRGVGYFVPLSLLVGTALSFWIPRTTRLTSGDWPESPILVLPKLLAVGIISIWVLLLLIRRRSVPALLAGAMVVPLYTPLSVPMSIGLVGMTCYWLLRKRIGARELIVPSIAAVLMLVWLYFLYAGGSTPASRAVGDRPLLNYLLSSDGALRAVKVGLVAFTMALIGRLLLWGPAWFIARDETRLLIRSIGLGEFLMLHFSSILAYSVLHSMVDSVQLWSAIALTLASIEAMLVLNALLSVPRTLNYAVAGVVLTTMIWQGNIIGRKHGNQVDEVFFSQAEKLIGGDSLRKNVAFIEDRSSYDSWWRKNTTYSPLPQFALKHFDYNPFCLSVVDIPLSDDPRMRAAERRMIENTPFYKYWRHRRASVPTSSTAQLQASFIREYGIRWLLVGSRAVLSPDLQALVDMDSALTEKGGWKMYPVLPKH